MTSDLMSRDPVQSPAEEQNTQRMGKDISNWIIQLKKNNPE